MAQNRPINLDLTTVKFPLTAITSILHRISGVLLFLSLPTFLWLLATSLESRAGYQVATTLIGQGWFMVVFWGMLSALLYHILAGFRHLIMDCGFFETVASAKVTATIMLLLFIVLAAALGVWLW